MIVENLAKLSGHYMLNMPLINKALIESNRSRLFALESGPEDKPLTYLTLR
jgi:hypothetical protein